MMIERDAQQSETFRWVANSSVFRSALLVCAILSITAGVGVSAETGTTARISDAGDAVEVTYPASYGVPNDSIPLYHVGKVRYFSAGIGLEEREATYPAFALKLVFVAEGRSFDPMVEVSITDAKGRAVVTIPKDQVSGPWLFVDLPAGNYTATAERLGHKVSKQVSVAGKGTKTVYFHWR